MALRCAHCMEKAIQRAEEKLLASFPDDDLDAYLCPGCGADPAQHHTPICKVAEAARALIHREITSPEVKEAKYPLDGNIYCADCFTEIFTGPDPS